jgi:hypothetical protein
MKMAYVDSADLASTEPGKGAALVGTESGLTVQQALNGIEAAAYVESADLASTDSGKGAALVGTETGATVQQALNGSGIIAVQPGSGYAGALVALAVAEAAVAEASASAVVRLEPDVIYDWAATTIIPTGVIIEVPASTTIRASAAMTHMFTWSGDDCGIRGVGGMCTIDANSLVTGFVIAGHSGQRPRIENIHLIGWKLGIHYLATNNDVDGLVCHNVVVDNPKVTAQTAGDRLGYPIQFGGGPNHNDLTNISVRHVAITGVGGNYQQYTGTPDQLAIQNAVGGEVAYVRSSKSGENGIAIARMSRNLHVHHIEAWENNGNGIQLGSAIVRLTVDDPTGLTPGNEYTASTDPTVKGRIDAIVGNYVYLLSVQGPGNSLLWTTADTIDGHAITEVHWAEGFDFHDVEAWNNSQDAPGLNSGIVLQYVRGRGADFHRLRAYDDQASKTQAYGLSVARCENMRPGSGNDFSGNLTKPELWSQSPDYEVFGFKEEQGMYKIPSLAAGQSLLVDFTFPGVVGASFVTMSVTGNTGLTFIPSADVSNKIRVRITNQTGASYTGEADRVFRFYHRPRTPALSNTATATPVVV